jgi:putative ABC transport system ATP-binding protein
VDNIIEVRTLSVSRRGVPVLHDVSFSVAAGEILVIIGPSGGGKSTLLRCLNRLEEAGAGQIFLQDQDITAIPVTELRCRVGMIFQKTAPFNGSIAENLCYGPSLRGIALSRERQVELLELASLPVDLLDKNALELSGGQEQRLAIARALANEPQVLLLDEPTSALDPIVTRNVEESLLRLRDQLGLTLVWVSHAIEQARRVADRVLLLDEGRVLRVDSASAMLDPDNGDPRALAFATGDEKGLHDS